MRDTAHEGKMDLKSLQGIPPWDWPADAGVMFLDILRDDQAAESDRPVLEYAAPDGFQDGAAVAIPERMFNTIREVFTDAAVPKEVRRRIDLRH